MLSRIRQYAHSASGRLLPGAICRTGDRGSVCLTFDDGPHPEATPGILEVLDALSMKATFFFNGSECEQYPDLVTDCAGRGHQIGNHGFRHRRHVGARSSIESSIRDTQNEIYAITGTRPKHFRPPHGYWLPFNTSILRAEKLSLVLWSCMPGDFLPHTTSDDVSGYLRRSLRGGDIIVLHGNACTAGRIEQIVRAACAVVSERSFTPGFIP